VSLGSIQVEQRGRARQTVAITQPTVSIGSAPGNQIVLDDPAVAGQHAQILSDARSNDLLVLADPSVVRVDGVAPEAGIPVPIKSGSQITIGGARLTFTRTSDAEDLLSSLLGTRERTTRQLEAPQLPPISRSVHSAPTQVVPTVQAPVPREQLLVLSMKRAVDAVEPGGAAVWVVEVVNRSERVDQARLLVEGVPEAWVLVTPPSHNLAPGTAGESSIQITPPRASESEAGIYDVAITARFVAQASVSATVEQDLEVTPFDQFQVYPLDPQKVTSWRQASYTFRIQNQSNHPQRFQLTGRDQEQVLAYRFTPEAPTVMAARMQTVQMQVQLPARQARLLGDPQPYDFSVDIQPIGSSATLIGPNGTLVQKPLLPRRARPIMIYGGIILTLLSCITLALAQLFPQIQALINPLFGRTTPTALTATPTVLAEAPTPTLGLPASPAPLPPTEVPAPTVDVQGTAAANQQEQAAQAAATQTALVGQNSGTQTAVIQQLGQTQTPQAQTQVALPTLLLQTAQANSVATQTQVALVQQATQTADAFTLAMTQTIAAFGAQQTQTAAAATQQAGIGATQTSLAIGFAQTQTAASLFLTQTALAQPTAGPTATIPPTPIADVVVRFDATPVTAPITIPGNQYLDGEISICMLGRYFGSDNVSPLPSLQQDSRCRLPNDSELVSSTDEGTYLLYPLQVEPAQALFNTSRSFLSNLYTDGVNPLYVIVAGQRDMSDLRVTLVHTDPEQLTYQIRAYDEQGLLISLATRNISVTGPYALTVAAQRPIRQVVIGIVDPDEYDRINGISLKPIVVQVEVNYTRR
jgi:hypothetical protein